MRGLRLAKGSKQDWHHWFLDCRDIVVRLCRRPPWAPFREILHHSIFAADSHAPNASCVPTCGPGAGGARGRAVGREIEREKISRSRSGGSSQKEKTRPSTRCASAERFIPGRVHSPSFWIHAPCPFKAFLDFVRFVQQGSCARSIRHDLPLFSSCAGSSQGFFPLFVIGAPGRASPFTRPPHTLWAAPGARLQLSSCAPRGAALRCTGIRWRRRSSRSSLIILNTASHIWLTRPRPLAQQRLTSAPIQLLRCLSLVHFAHARPHLYHSSFCICPGFSHPPRGSMRSI